MNYYLLNPEIAGELGDNSIIEYENGKIKEVLFLEYTFMGWQGDELLSTHPCFIVTKNLQEDIIVSGLSGVVFKEIAVSFSEDFYEIYPNIKLPPFVQIVCQESCENSYDNLQYDFYYNKYKDIIVSERALDVLQKHKMDMCIIKKYI